MTDMPPLESYLVGGVRISCVDRVRATESFFRLVSARTGGFITVTSAHGVVEAQSDSRLRGIINDARMTLADGTPVAWAGKWQGAAVERVTGASFVDAIMTDARARALRHYFYGSQPSVLDAIMDRVCERLGAAAIAGAYSPPLRAAGELEQADVLERIGASGADVVWVVLSTPKQEYWMANHAASLPGVLLVGVGAAFEFFVGAQIRAPRLIQDTGFEWLYRLMREPARLWPRYSRVVPGMLKVLARDMIRRSP